MSMNLLSAVCRATGHKILKYYIRTVMAYKFICLSCKIPVIVPSLFTHCKKAIRLNPLQSAEEI
jgi:hypothetical protein